MTDTIDNPTRQLRHVDFADFLSSIEDVIEDARNGRMFILVDHEDRENEGDLIIPAQMAGPDAINFMAKYGRGLICLALTHERAEHLGLELMSRKNQTRHQTAFTVSIEAKHGVSTGISAHDRARTISVAIDPKSGPDDIVTPGHVFPLVARDGGVLVRTGHTEAAVDIARLAGLNPSGVICEIMNDDGTMARLPDLVQFAQLHGIKVATIADLISYRRRHDHFLQLTAEQDVESEFGGTWHLKVWVNQLDRVEHVALIKGDVTTAEPVLVRVHTTRLFNDLIGAVGVQHDAVRKSMGIIAEAGRGVIVVVRDIEYSIVADHFSPPGPARKQEKELREIGIGAQILSDLGVKEMVVLSNTPRNLIALQGYDLKVVGHRPIP
jgi:3,4-dihydroxy 2-butanone 4-phosphate synthase / GTP cyclohydrolase II